jgi:hypothetical protein
MVEIDLERCKQDVLVIGSFTIQQIPCPYNILDNWEISMQSVYTKFKEKGRSRHRIMTMVYAFYVGELINLSITPREKWLEFAQSKQIRREHHFYKGITRVYDLFKLNVEQIYRTSYLSYRKLLNMKAYEYRELVNYHQSISEITFDEL